MRAATLYLLNDMSLGLVGDEGRKELPLGLKAGDDLTDESTLFNVSSIAHRLWRYAYLAYLDSVWLDGNEAVNIVSTPLESYEVPRQVFARGHRTYVCSLDMMNVIVL